MMYSGINNLAMGYSYSDLLLSSEIDGYIQDINRAKCLDNGDSYILKYCFVRKDLVDLETTSYYIKDCLMESCENMRFND